MSASHGYLDGGLDLGRFRIEKRLEDGSYGPVDLGASYWVLRIDADPHARVALAAYAQSLSTENPGLARDLLALLQWTKARFDEHYADRERRRAAGLLGGRPAIGSDIS